MFGLDLKSLILGLLLGWFALPWVLAKFSAVRTPAATA